MNKPDVEEGMTLNNKTKTMLGAAFCCILWGSAFPMIKIGYKFLGIAGNDTMGIIEYAGIRFFLAGFLVIVFGSIREKKLILPAIKEIPLFIILSLFQTIGQYIFFYVGLAHTSGVNAAVINSLNTVFAIIIACLIFKLEKINLKKIIGCILGVIGVFLISFDGTGITFNLLGDGLIVLTALSYGVSSNLIKIYSKNHNTVMLSGYQFMFGGLVMTIVGVIGRNGKVLYDFSDLGLGIIALIYLALVSSVAYTLWGILLKKNEVSRIAVYGFVTPVAGVVLSMIILGESSVVGWIYFLALLLVSISIIAVNYSGSISQSIAVIYLHIIKKEHRVTKRMDDIINNNRLKNDVLEDRLINGVIEDQHSLNDMRLGASDMAYSGCEVISLYNALLLTDAGHKLSEIISLTESSGYLVRKGIWGTNPLCLDRINIDDRFKLHRINSIPTEPGIYIVSFWNSRRLFDGIHTVCVQLEDGWIHAYNYHSADDLFEDKSIIVMYRGYSSLA